MVAQSSDELWLGLGSTHGYGGDLGCSKAGKTNNRQAGKRICSDGISQFRV